LFFDVFQASHPNADMLLAAPLPIDLRRFAAKHADVALSANLVWPKDKDGNIIKPSWWVDEESCATVRAQSLGSAD
jgi:hypothetical protein